MVDGTELPRSLPNLLIVAGLDPSGGAGLLADARVAYAHGVRALGVATGLTEQDTTGARAANVVAADIVEAQLRALLADVEVAAVKIGMLGSEAIAHAVACALDATRAPVVWDPVLLPTAGRIALYEGNATRAVQLLSPHVTLLTPNLDEAAVLTGAEVADVAGMHRAAGALRAAGLRGVLVTGGHLPGPSVTDVLATSAGVVEMTRERVGPSGSVHGTGCALASAIACRLASGVELTDAVRGAQAFVAQRLRAPQRPGRGAAAIV
jgi:hydroxymethylpyrimidine/phosphomethylpyrimidine kinase